MKLILTLGLTILLSNTIAATKPFACEPKRYQKQPTDSVIINLAKNASHHIFSLSSEKELTALQSCFSTTGWQSFSNALNKTQMLNTIQSKEIIATPTISDQVTIIEHRQTPPAWTVQLPVIVHYENSTHELNKKLIVTLTIELHGKQLAIESVNAHNRSKMGRSIR